MANEETYAPVARANTESVVDDLSVGVLHDIRHHAATVGLLVRLLQECGDDRAAARAATNGIASCARTIMQLVDRATITSATRLDLVVDNVADQTRLLHRGRLMLVTEPVLVRARRLDLVRIVTNLLDNAREAAGDDGLIAVVVQRAGSRVVMKISNQATAPSTEMEGTGLSIVAELVARAGGLFAAEVHDGEVEAVIDFPLFDTAEPDDGIAS